MQDLASAIGNARGVVIPNEYWYYIARQARPQGIGNPPAKLDL
ncbi:hypothetical protein [Rhodococcus erythropolis]|nr:hypothetical protein [Rhodococcus erythropolis]